MLRLGCAFRAFGAGPGARASVRLPAGAEMPRKAGATNKAGSKSRGNGGVGAGEERAARVRALATPSLSPAASIRAASAPSAGLGPTRGRGRRLAPLACALPKALFCASPLTPSARCRGAQARQPSSAGSAAAAPGRPGPRVLTPLRTQPWPAGCPARSSCAPTESSRTTNVARQAWQRSPGAFPPDSPTWALPGSVRKPSLACTARGPCLGGRGGAGEQSGGGGGGEPALRGGAGRACGAAAAVAVSPR